MGRAANIAFAIFTIVPCAVIAFSSHQVESAANEARNSAAQKVSIASKQTWFEFQNLLQANRDLCVALTRDAAFQSAWTHRDRAAVASAFKHFASANHTSGTLSVYDSEGKVFYSTDDPAHFGYSVATQIPELAIVLQKNVHYSGAAIPTKAGILGIINIQTVPTADGAVAIFQPMNTQFLQTLQEELAKSEPGADNKVELIAWNIDNNRLQSATPTLKGHDGGYMLQLDREGLAAVKPKEYEYGGHMWRAVPLLRSEGIRNPGVVIVGAPIASTAAVLASQTTIEQAAIAVLAITFIAFLIGRRRR